MSIGDMRNVDNFCTVGKVSKFGKVSNNIIGAVGRLWRHEKC